MASRDMDRQAGSSALTSGLVWCAPLAESLRRGLAEHARIELQGVRRLAAPSAADAAAQLDELLIPGGPGAIVLAVPVGVQRELVLRCLRAGRHVLVQAPLARASADARALVATAAAARLVLMGGQTTLYRRSVQRVRVLLERGELGRTEAISITHVRVGTPPRDPDVLWDLGPQEVARLRFWLGEAPRSVRASGPDPDDPGAADLIFMTLTFPSGATANVELRRTPPERRRRTVLLGTEKMLVFEDDAPDPVHVFDHDAATADGGDHARRRHLFYRPPDIARPRPEARSSLALELDDFALAIEGGRPLWDPELAVDVVRTLEAVDRSIAAGGAEVPLADAAPAGRSLADAP